MANHCSVAVTAANVKDIAVKLLSMPSRPWATDSKQIATGAYPVRQEILCLIILVTKVKKVL